MQCLENWFEKANLPHVIENNSFRTRFSSVNNPDIFQLTIDVRKSKETGNEEEYFRMFLGHNNDIRVIDYDAKKQQVLLLVKEPPRTYTRKNWDPKKKENEVRKSQTSEFLSKYLMGMDESHLFISELPSHLGVINKIKDAYKILKPEFVIKKEREINRIKRQGEWFFIPVGFKDQILIDKNKNLIKKKARIGYGIGNPHIADSLLRIKKRINKKEKTLTFVKGKIYHVDHKTLTLPGWFKVERNTELRPTSKQLESLNKEKKTKQLDDALFIPATQDELSLMDKYKVKVRKKISMGCGWKNAYVAEKLMCLKGSKNVKGMTLVNGEIKDKKGKSVKLDRWHKVERDPEYKPPIKQEVRVSRWVLHQNLLDRLEKEERNIEEERRRRRSEGLRVHWID